MPSGIELYNPDGSPFLSLVDRVGKYLVVFTIGPGASGSVTVPQWGQGYDPIFFVQHQGLSNGYYPQLTLSGTVLSWSPNTVYVSQNSTTFRPSPIAVDLYVGFY